jgi:hypothetical protein
MIVSNFEILLQPIGPGGNTSSGDAKLAPDVTPEDAPKAGDVLRPYFVPPELAASGLPFVVPTALQGYFLYLSNTSPFAASGIRVGFVSEDARVLGTIVPAPGGGAPAFLAITNTQPPLISGNTNTSGISFGALKPSSAAVAFTDLPTIPGSGTILLGVIPNYLSPALVNSGPVARGYVDIRTTNGDKVSLNISAQTRVVFFEPGNTGAGMDTSEAAYSMPSPTGGTAFTFSGV